MNNNDELPAGWGNADTSGVNSSDEENPWANVQTQKVIHNNDNAEKETDDEKTLPNDIKTSEDFKAEENISVSENKVSLPQASQAEQSEQVEPAYAENADNETTLIPEFKPNPEVQKKATAGTQAKLQIHKGAVIAVVTAVILVFGGVLIYKSASDKVDDKVSNADLSELSVAEITTLTKTTTKATTTKAITTTAKETTTKVTTTTATPKKDNEIIQPYSEAYLVEEEYTVTSDTDYLNIRYGPSKDYDVIFKISNGDTVNVLAKYLNDDYKWWAYITYGDKSGWCMLDLITQNDNIDSDLLDINNAYYQVCQENSDAESGFVGDFDGDGQDDLVLNYGYQFKVEFYSYVDNSACLMKTVDIKYGMSEPQLYIVKNDYGTDMVTITTGGSGWIQYYIENLDCDIFYNWSFVYAELGGKKQNENGNYLVDWTINEDNIQVDSGSGYTYTSLVDGCESGPEELITSWRNLTDSYGCMSAMGMGMDGGCQQWELLSLSDLMSNLNV